MLFPFAGALAPLFLAKIPGRLDFSTGISEDEKTSNVGVMTRDIYAICYNFMIEGISLGAKCLTFGYMSGKDNAQGDIETGKMINTDLLLTIYNTSQAGSNPPILKKVPGQVVFLATMIYNHVS